MAEFSKAFPYLLASEGGYSNHPADRGGATKYGITERKARAAGYRGDMRQLPIEFAKGIYRQDYWRFDGIESQRVATKMLDMAANFGLSIAITLLQIALNAGDAKLKTDGVLGPITLGATNARDESWLLAQLCIECQNKYSEILTNDASQKIFKHGWATRARRVPE